jgi:fructose-1,6-bisphosphatase/inositol monophosphatase family enzyme/glycerophosphoryl diester phosphodiesterase
MRPVQTCAHRGNSNVYRENTLPAIRSAIAAGADFVEIDVRVTADDQVIVLHDATLERLWGLPSAVSDVTLEQVRSLGGADERPPLLSEVIELFDGAPSTLLIDMDDPTLAEPAYRVVASVLSASVLSASVLSASGATSAAPGAGDPASRTAVAWCGDIDGMRTIRRLDAGARIWMPWDSPTAPTADDIGDLAPERINTEFLTMTRQLAEQIHALGYGITVWTVDDESSMRWAQRIGVDTVTTNRLGRLQRVASSAEDDGAFSEGTGPSTHDAVDIDEAIAVARGLAQWAIEFSSSADPGQIDTKKDAADLVTEVDVAVERHVREVVEAHFPSHDFVGEEMGGGARRGVPCWYLDPVDGTANFANRIPWNAFSLALAVDDQPLVAVVADPWRGDLFEAVAGRGARLNGSVLRLPEAADSVAAARASDPLAGRIVSTELANQAPWPGMLELLERLGERFCTMRVMGSGTMTVVGVAAGRGAGAVIGKFGAVDHVAAALIVREAGGVVLDSAGQPNLFPASGGIMAAAPGASDALYALWRDSVAAHASVP